MNYVAGISKAIDYYKAQKVFGELGFEQDTLSMHMVFTGNPGTKWEDVPEDWVCPICCLGKEAFSEE